MVKGMFFAISGTVILIVVALMAYSYGKQRPSSNSVGRPPSYSSTASAPAQNSSASATVARILEDSIIVASGESEMTLSKDPSVVQIYKRTGNSTTATSYDALRPGQKVTVDVIVPGQKVVVYIEE